MRFGKLFFRSLEMTGDIFFQAPTAKREALLARLVEVRRLPPIDWALKQVLSPGDACRLAGYQLLATMDTKLSQLPTLVVHISQEPGKRQMA